ncbi:MAG: ParB/RepB/Spo0J family partition protein [Alphaproteobacteria bacterium]|nr:ParB/RepB/Spo0J family partition protein [Alphaproteobacteria bacterium]
MSPEAKKPAEQRKRLGRGLSALLGEAAAETAPVASAPRAAKLVPVGSIRPNEFQPRRQFNKEEMEELTGSVKAHGVLQPILVRRDPKDANRYELIAGERRWRAAQAAQLHEIPAVVRDLTDTETLELALIENLQREDLTPIEEARAFRRLMDEFGHTQEKLAQALGKSRSLIANLVRLLDLPPEVQQMIERGQLSAGHGRLLVNRADATLLAGEWVRGAITVREAEALIAGTKTRPQLRQKGKPGKGGTILRDANTDDLERRMTHSLGVKVRILHNKGLQSGIFQVYYSTLDQLDDIIDRIGGTSVPGVKPPQN